MGIYTTGDLKSFSASQLGIDAIPGNLLAHGKEHVQSYAKAAGYSECWNIYDGFSNGSSTDHIDVEAMVSHDGLRGKGIVVDIGLDGSAAYGLYLVLFNKFF